MDQCPRHLIELSTDTLFMDYFQCRSTSASLVKQLKVVDHMAIPFPPTWDG